MKSLHQYLQNNKFENDNVDYLKEYFNYHRKHEENIMLYIVNEYKFINIFCKNIDVQFMPCYIHIVSDTYMFDLYPSGDNEYRVKIPSNSIKIFNEIIEVLRYLKLPIKIYICPIVSTTMLGPNIDIPLKFLIDVCGDTKSHPYPKRYGVCGICETNSLCLEFYNELYRFYKTNSYDEYHVRRVKSLSDSVIGYHYEVSKKIKMENTYYIVNI